MEKIRLSGISVQLLFPKTLVFADWLSSCPILFGFADRICRISIPVSLFQSHSNTRTPPQRSSSYSELTQERNLLSREDVKSVMEKLELFFSQKGEEEGGEYFSSDELTAMFEENEPSLEELKETFNVFDRNKDGFIDGEELHTVLPLVGFSDVGKDIEECTKMIASFDHNKDGKIDFDEFVKLMEIALC